MRSVDRLEQQRRMKQQKRKNSLLTDEEAEEEMERPKPMFLNRNKSAFDSGTGNGQGGINNAPSVFDRQAVFRTSFGENENQFP